MSKFGVMLDLSRNGVMKISKLKEFAKTIKSFGYDNLGLYMEDTYEVENEPYFGYLRGAYSVSELKELDKYCASIGIEVIPYVQTLAHLRTIFRWGDYEKIKDIDDILLVRDDRTYTLIDNMFKSLRQSFSSNLIHIGVDEARLIGRGKYLDKNGYDSIYNILAEHLKKVVEIAKKYGFTPIMWSDMFFSVESDGSYNVTEKGISDDMKNVISNDIEVAYWEYYSTDKKRYDKMFKAHKELSEKVWYAGSIITWQGFAPKNKKSLNSMSVAMQSCKDNDIKNIVMTIWGDNGRECTPFSTLADLYAVKRIYDGEQDLEKIKAEFNKITGENFDWFTSLDDVDILDGTVNDFANPCKALFYNDPFLGFFDTTIVKGYKEEYLKLSEQFRNIALKSRYGYLFKSHEKLSKFMSLKFDLGFRTRKAYQEKDKKGLKIILKDYGHCIKYLNEFYDAYKIIWEEECKPFGFEVQDIRIGALLFRLKTCKDKLQDYLSGKLAKIEELEIDLLDFYKNNKNYTKRLPFWLVWQSNVTANVL